MTKASLNDLVAEIILMIVGKLDHQHDIYSLALTCRYLFGICNQELYQFNIRNNDSAVLRWAVRAKKENLVSTLLKSYSPNVNTVSLPVSYAAFANEQLTTFHERNGHLPWAQHYKPVFRAELPVEYYTMTPLMDAAKQGSGSILRLLVERADIKITDGAGRGALWHAVNSKNVVGLRYLLDQTQINVNDQDHEGETALLLAVGRRQGNREMIQSLLAVDGIDVNLPNHRGDTPLHRSIRKRCTEATALLLSHPKININQLDRNGCTPLIQAICNNDRHCIRTLLRHPGMDIHRGRPLCYAAERGNMELVQKLVRGGADVNQRHQDGKPTLSCAASGGHWQVVTYVLGIKGIGINMRDRKGRTALHEACRSTAFTADRVVRRLLAEPEININAKDYKGKTALCHAVEAGDTGIVELFSMKDNIEIHAIDRQQATDVHHSLVGGDPYAIGIILRQRDENMVNGKMPRHPDGTAPLDLATWVARKDSYGVSILLPTLERLGRSK